MIAVLSPAKRLDWETPVRRRLTVPRFQPQAEALADAAKALTAADLQRLMGVSDAIAGLNVARFQHFGQAKPRAAIDAFAGDVYHGFDKASLDIRALTFAQRHVRILSGLYGLLRPFDAIQPYRLEMGTRWGGTEPDLYALWGRRIAEALNADLAGQRSRAVINLASVEYFSAVDITALQGRVITVDFRERKDGQLRMNSFAAKRARGMMARYMCETRAAKPEALQGFCAADYAYDPRLSRPERYTFVRQV